MCCDVSALLVVCDCGWIARACVRLVGLLLVHTPTWIACAVYVKSNKRTASCVPPLCERVAQRVEDIPIWIACAVNVKSDACQSWLFSGHVICSFSLATRDKQTMSELDRTLFHAMSFDFVFEKCKQCLARECHWNQCRACCRLDCMPFTRRVWKM